MNRSVFMGIKGLLIASSWAVGCGSAFAQVGGGAVPLPPSFSESVTSTSFVTGRSSTQSGSGPYDVTNGAATAGTSYTLATEGEASLTIDAGSALAQQASASVTWNFIVNGPANQSTFVFLVGRGDQKVVKPAGDLDIDDASATISGDAFQLSGGDQTSNGEQRFGISLGAYLETNTVYTIIETLSAYSFPLDGTTDLVQASFDPTVSLGDTSGVYSITLSPVSVPVPEPATWAMMLAGFGLVGFGLRSSRRQAVRVTYA
jgi:PEP-CTERM motif